MLFAVGAYIAVCSGLLLLGRSMNRLMRDRSVQPKDILLGFVGGCIGALVALLATASFVDSHEPTSRLLIAAAVLLAFIIVTFSAVCQIERLRARKFASLRLSLVEKIHAQFFSGLSPIAALEQLAHTSTRSDRLLLIEIHRCVVFLTRELSQSACSNFDSIAWATGELRSQINEFASRVVQISLSERDQREQFHDWKLELQRSMDLRHRSGQMLRPIYAQLTLILILYAGLGLTGFLFFQKDDVSDAIRISSPLMIVGIIWLRRVGRRIRWTV